MLHLILAALLALAAPPAADAAGPWKAQIVDAETGQPIADAVIVLVWVKRFWSFPHYGRAVHDAAEAVSDADGRISIPARNLSTWVPLTWIESPWIDVFRAGYGRWRFKGSPDWDKSDWDAYRERVKGALDQFEKDGVVIELAPVKSLDERARRRPDALLDVPAERVPRWHKARRAEEDHLRLHRRRP